MVDFRCSTFVSKSPHPLQINTPHGPGLATAVVFLYHVPLHVHVHTCMFVVLIMKISNQISVQIHQN